MKKKVLTIIAALTLTVCCLTFVGCGSEDSGYDKEVIGTCTITIPDFCDAQEKDILEGDTVYDILMASGVELAGTPVEGGMSIDMINGVENGSKGETSGWMYSVNGEFPTVYCDKLEVKDGDEIVWEFYEGM